MKPFAVPVVTLGPGSQEEGETLDYMRMPEGMQTFSVPVLPEPEQLAGRTPVKDVLRAILGALATLATVNEAGASVRNPRIDLQDMDEDNRRLLGQILGEGEVSARIAGEGAGEVLIQESVFAGVWRVIDAGLGDDAIQDYIEVGAAPHLLVTRALAGVQPDRPHVSPLSGTLADGVMNAPSILTEIRDYVQDWRAGQAAHVINLTLLPLSPQDVVYLDDAMGAGDVTILSRGYGNCRISATRARCCWRVVYFNSQDAMILNTIEITSLPDVACAAPEDLRDSRERLADVLEWVEQA